MKWGLSAASPPPKEVHVGRYEILSLVGVGGMAEVFRARAHGPGGYQRELIIKRILPHFAQNPAFIRAFVEEAKILGMLSHPNIVGVYDFGEDAGRHYLALEYLDGLSLAEMLSRRRRAQAPIPIGVVAFIVREVALGLSAVHTLQLPNGDSLNVIHRDVTPSNIMTTRAGGVKLLDFGIAKSLIGETFTRRGEIKGKAGYLAPEQVRGEVIDARVDLFALGIVLYELLTLEPLFQGEGGDIAAAYRILEMPIVPPSQHRADVPPALDEIAMRALVRDRNGRFPTALDMSDALDQVIRATGVRRDDLRQFIASCVAMADPPAANP
ncbi:MAG TPA: serine/threonine-protein kinase [Polyangia bacterium]|nr:serine/threonine-protein kinase [Polyangia bacterium]